MNKLVQSWLNRVIFVWPWNGYKRPKLKRGKNLYLVNRINCTPLLLNSSEHTAYQNRKKILLESNFYNMGILLDNQTMPFKFYGFIWRQNEESTFFTITFRSLHCPWTFHTSSPILSKNLRKLLKMSLFRCLERWESFLSEKTKLNQKGFDATQKRSEPETLLLRDCKFLNQISVGM